MLIFFGAGNVAFGQLDSTNLPLFVINTDGKPIMDEPKITGDLKIIYNDGYNRIEDLGNVYNGKIGIEVRGRYSATLPQKPYGFETRDEAVNNRNVPLFHMPAENDWILLANYNDKTFLRNSLAFELFRKMGHYAPRTQYCEVIVNNEYQGIYILTEKIKRDAGRVDIATLSPDENSGDDLKGGYIFKVDYFNDSDSWMSSYPPLGYVNKKVHFVYYYPEPNEITPNQKKYLQDFVYNFETTLYSQLTPDRRQELYELMDINSFIDYFIIGELSRNVDAYKKSSYFHKDKNGKLHAGPVWDFDWSWKNINECYFGGTDGSGWAYQVHQCNPWPVPPTWMNKLLQEAHFRRKLGERYVGLRTSYLSEDYLFSYIDSVASVLGEAQKRHFSKWRILGRNVGTPEVDYQPTSYAGEITKFKNWISVRLQWLDKRLPGFYVTEIQETDLICDQIFPNPVSDLLQVKSLQEVDRYQVRGIDGKEVLNEVVKSSDFTINTSEMKAGVYLLHLQRKDGNGEVKKFIKSD